VWLETCCQFPLLLGETGGRELPSAAETAFEKVRVMGVVGPIREPGTGLATAAAAVPAGNQLTAVEGAVSQVRGVAATQTVPAVAVRGSVTSVLGDPSCWRFRWLALGPYDTAATGWSNETRSGSPCLSVK
jgi:hypothetical protein